MLVKLMKLIVFLLLIMLNQATIASDTNSSFYSEEKRNIAVLSTHPEFIIQLKSNPTTGYSWYLRDYDGNILSPVKHVFVKPNSQLMGAPGYERWTFKVKPAGFIVPQQTTLRFIYTRPWQAGENATQLVFHVSTSK